MTTPINKAAQAPNPGATDPQPWFKIYRTSLGATARIESVRVERHTQDSVWIAGRRRAQLSSYESYFPTWEAAHAVLMDDAEQYVLQLRAKLDRANGSLGNVKGMKAPCAIRLATNGEEA